MTIGVSEGMHDNADIVVSLKTEGDSYVDVPHMHSRYEIYYNISGARAFMCEGKVYKCSEKNLIVVPRICAHKVFVEKGAHYDRCIISVDEVVVDMLSMLCQSDEALSWITDATSLSPSIAKLTDTQHRAFIILCEKYLKAKSDGDILGSLGCFVKILSFLKKCFETSQDICIMAEDEMTVTERVLVHIEQHFKTINISALCRELYFSEDHLNRIFKTETGMTVKQYITLRKIAEAKKYLYLGKTAKEACFLSGFRDYSNFRRSFKNYEGYNPGNLEELTSPI